MAEHRRIQIAQRLRRKSTPPERVMWGALRSRRLGGFKFRRQQAIGGYVVDFFCSDARLIVELDGGRHAGNQERDARRDQWLRDEGYEVLRFTVSQFMKTKDVVFTEILRVARMRAQS